MLWIELPGNPCYLELMFGLNGRNKSPFGVGTRKTKVFGLTARVWMQNHSEMSTLITKQSRSTNCEAFHLLWSKRQLRLPFLIQ